MTATVEYPTAVTDRHTITVYPVTGDGRSAVHVTADAEEAADSVLAELARRERALGDRRCSTRGEFPDVDELYDDLNHRRAIVGGRLARQALRDAAALFDDAPNLTKARYSRTAGCSCPCSPGLRVPGGLYADGRRVYVWVKLARDER